MSTDKQKIGSVLVIGGGIAGMQASLDLADELYLFRNGDNDERN